MSLSSDPAKPRRSITNCSSRSPSWIVRHLRNQKSEHTLVSVSNPTNLLPSSVDKILQQRESRLTIDQYRLQCGVQRTQVEGPQLLHEFWHVVIVPWTFYVAEVLLSVCLQPLPYEFLGSCIEGVKYTSKIMHRVSLHTARYRTYDNPYYRDVSLLDLCVVLCFTFNFNT